MTARYGSASISLPGTSPNAGVIASCSRRALVPAKISAPRTAGYTRQRAKMTSAMHTQPRPGDDVEGEAAQHGERGSAGAPPIAIRAPPTISATYRVRATEMPATSAASKSSPTACNRMPSPKSSRAPTGGDRCQHQEAEVGEQVLAEHLRAAEQHAELVVERGPLTCVEEPERELAAGDQQQAEPSESGDVARWLSPA